MNDKYTNIMCIILVIDVYMHLGKSSKETNK